MLASKILISKLSGAIEPEGWNISTAVFNSSYLVRPQDSSPTGLFFRPDGSQFFITGDATNTIWAYSLSTPWDVTTASVIDSFATIDATPTGIFFKPDGTKMYTSGTTTDNIYEYELSTPWQLTGSANQTSSFNVASQETNPQDVFFKPDGTKFYTLGQFSDQVWEYDTTIPWSVASASLAGSVSITAQDGTPTGLWFKPDGTKMYSVGINNDNVSEYTLATPWSVSTASFVQNFSIADRETSVRAINFNSTGTKMFILGLTSDSVIVYDVGE